MCLLKKDKITYLGNNANWESEHHKIKLQTQTFLLKKTFFQINSKHNQENDE